VFNPQGIRSLLSHSDTIDILPVWIQAGEKERLLRSLNREQNPNCAEVCRRFLADQKDFANIEFEHEIFLNDKENEEYYGFLNRPKILNFIEGQT
jgi:guanylate kinase